MSTTDNRQAAYFLASGAAVLAARRARGRNVMPAPPPGEEHVAMVQCENLLLELSGNPLLAILVRSLGLANFYVDEAPHWRSGKLDLLTFNEFNYRIFDAVHAGDEEAAGALARSKAQFIESMLDERPRAA